tara:strand:- start:846 stop:3935 length:3090 start_codon:yes stop_codon:yes gene_type:complete
MAINERLIDTKADSSGVVDEANLTLELDAGDVDSYDGTGDVWYDIHNFEFTPTTNVAENFNTVLYDGTSGVNVINTVGFQPDLVWIKVRNNSGINALTNSINGDTTFNVANTDAAIGTNSSAPKSFNSLGFTLGSGNANWNSSLYEYVAWCFKAGGAPSGTDKVSIDGTSYSTMTAAGLTNGSADIVKLSINTDLGFSIAKYTGSGTASATVAHGLDTPPEMLIVKRLENPEDWAVYHKSAESPPEDYVLILNENYAAGNNATRWNDTAPTSTFFTVGSSQAVNAAEDYIAYCFASKRGVSEVGGYIGTGAAGNFIFTGFEPAFLLQKSTSSGNWHIFDNKRNANNPRVTLLSPNTNSQEGNISGGVDFNRNGFTFITTNSALNGNGQTYIYYAVAANTNETGLTPDTAGFTQGTTKSPTVLNLQGAGYTGSGDWLDSSGNSNNGVITGATYVNQGNASYFDFNGTSNYVSFASNPVAGTGDFSISTWARCDNLTGFRYIAQFGSLANPGSGFALAKYDSTQSNKLYVHIGGETLISPHVVVLGAWTHYAVTQTGTTLKFYINGDLIDTFTTSYSPNRTNLNSALGYYTEGNANYWEGGIGQVRLYSSVLSPTDVQTNYEATKQYLLPYLELNLEAGNNSSYPGTGTTWFDLTSNDNDGTITGATWQQEVGNFFEFDGNNDDVKLGAFDISLNNQLTAEMWVNPESTQVQFSMLFDYQHTGTLGFAIQQQSNNLNTYQVYNVGEVTTFSLVANKWSHLVVTADGTDFRVYIDGELNVQATHTDVANTSGRTLDIGGWHNSTTARSFNGGIAQVRVYSTPLSLAQVRQNFNFTSSLYPNYFPGTLGAGAAKPVWDPAGYFEFDGSSDFVQTNLPIRSTDVSTSLWFKADAGGLGATNPPLFFTSNGGRIDILITGSTSNSVTANADSLQIQATTATTQFNHLAIVFEGFAPGYTGTYGTGITFTVYINGNSITSSGTLTPYAQTANGFEPNLRVGRSGGGFYFDGQISKVKAYTNALTPEEINILYSEGF